MAPRRSEKPNKPLVSSLLHILRGEEFRRRRNLQGIHARAPGSSSSPGPSLPPLFTDHLDPEEQVLEPHPHPAPPAVSKVAGPSPPRSWISSGPSLTHSESKEWRARALSLLVLHSPSQSPALVQPVNPRLPSLAQLCLHQLLEWGGIPLEVFPDLPRHILREYVRYSIVHGPGLPREELEALWSVDNAGCADGEIIISGPSVGSIIPRFLAPSTPVTGQWDSSSETEPEPPPVLHTLAIMSSSFPSYLVSLLPPTLTHLALLSVPSLPLHRLPTQLPHITFFDLSFNPWIGESAGRIARLDWPKWMNLEVLGMRECGLSDEGIKAIAEKVNRGRLSDVEIVTLTYG